MKIITSHTNPDFDSISSILAAKKLYPCAIPVFPESQEKGLRDFLLKSTVYFLDMKRPKEIDLSKIKEIVLVDTRSRSRLGRFSSIFKKGRDVKVYIYDHHPPQKDDIRGDFELVCEVGACVTLLVEEIIKRKIEITSDEATIMILGIYEETGSFTFTSTTPRDFEAASYLIKKGARLDVVSELIKRELDAEKVRLLDELLQSSRTWKIGGLNILISSCSSQDYVRDFAFVVQKLMDIENPDAAFVMGVMGNRIYIVARSRKIQIDVSKIMERFGGGGHAYAASCVVKDKTPAEVESMLIELVEKEFGLLAKNIMSWPANTIDAKKKIKDANTILQKFGVDGIVVVRRGKVCGVLSKETVDRAMYHGLSDIRVEEFMNVEFKTVSPESPLKEVIEAFAQGRENILPVLDGKRVLGVITRDDILRVEVEGSISEDRSIRNLPIKRNYKKKLKDSVSGEIFDILQKAGEIAKDMGYEAYIVGGFVRDLVMGVKNFDIDIVIEGLGIEFAKKFAEIFKAEIVTHERFGTATLTLSKDFKIDVATSRMEYYESPASLPKVETGSLKYDLFRRDFTINSLAISLSPEKFGELIDFFGGLRDIKDRIIRVIHSLSFVEDPTRIFRALRFEQRLSFSVGKYTLNLIKNAVKTRVIDRLDGYRILSELKLIFLEDPIPVFRRMEELGLLQFLNPNLSFSGRLEDLFLSIKEVLSWYKLLYLKKEPKIWLVYLYALSHFLGEKEGFFLLKRLSIPTKRAQNMIKKLREKDFYKEKEIEFLLFLMALFGEEGKKSISKVIMEKRGEQSI